MSNPLGKVITKRKGRRLVISDIHGCSQSLRALLEKIQLSEEDQLFFLGDYVNKGPHSKEVLNCLIDLNSRNNTFFVLGNHDLMLLNYLKSEEDQLKAQLEDLNGSAFFSLSDVDKTKYISFLEDLHHYFISDEFILVHAGFNFNLQNPFLGREDMLNVRSFYYDGSKAMNKTIVHGHYPHPKSEIDQAIDEYQKVIPLDNGCVYHRERDEMGELLCLNLDTMELISQQNID